MNATGLLYANRRTVLGKTNLFSKTPAHSAATQTMSMSTAWISAMPFLLVYHAETPVCPKYCSTYKLYWLGHWHRQATALHQRFENSTGYMSSTGSSINSRCSPTGHPMEHPVSIYLRDQGHTVNPPLLAAVWAPPNKTLPFPASTWRCIRRSDFLCGSADALEGCIII